MKVKITIRLKECTRKDAEKLRSLNPDHIKDIQKFSY
jgi:hypothetical protein